MKKNQKVPETFSCYTSNFTIDSHCRIQQKMSSTWLPLDFENDFSKLFIFFSVTQLMTNIIPKGQSIVRRRESLRIKDQDNIPLSGIAENQCVSDTDDSLDSSDIHIRMTKRLDVDGKYRITTSASLRFTKCILRICGAFISVFLLSPSWYYRHFIEFDSNTISLWPYQILCAISFSEFAWEWALSTSPFETQKSNYALDAHHIISTLMGMLLLNGVYIPFATCFGIITQMFLFPAHFAIGLRIEFHDKYPKLVRSTLKWVGYYTLSAIVINILCVYSLIIWAFIHTDKINIGITLFFAIGSLAFIKQDYILIKTLKTYSTQHYELVNLYN